MFTENQPHSKALGLGAAKPTRVSAGRWRGRGQGRRRSVREGSQSLPAPAPAGRAGQAAGPGAPRTGRGSSPGVGPTPCYSTSLEPGSEPIKSSSSLPAPEASSGCRVVSDFTCVSKCLLLGGGGQRLQQGMDQTVDCLRRHSPPGAPLEGVRGAAVDLGAVQSLPSPGHGKTTPQVRFSICKGN